MWEAKVDGRPLRFHLAGINNQNFIMRDEETGSWWQQVSGEAIQGPMKGKRLNAVFWDELSFATWKRERPNGRVLLPDDRVKAIAGAAEKQLKAVDVPEFMQVGPMAMTARAGFAPGLWGFFISNALVSSVEPEPLRNKRRGPVPARS